MSRDGDDGGSTDAKLGNGAVAGPATVLTGGMIHDGSGGAPYAGRLAPIADHATGVEQVFVNGRQVLKNGEPAGVAAGRFVKGQGAGKCPA